MLIIIKRKPPTKLRASVHYAAHAGGCLKLMNGCACRTQAVALKSAAVARSVDVGAGAGQVVVHRITTGSVGRGAMEGTGHCFLRLRVGKVWTRANRMLTPTV
jgi:hypothetical protein